LEFQNDPESKIVRPRQNYQGKMDLNYVDVQNRQEVTTFNIKFSRKVLN